MPRETTPKLCRHKGKGLYFVRLNGRQLYLGADRRQARREYDRLLAEWLAAGRRLPRGNGVADLTIAELCAAYRKHCERYYRDAAGQPTGQTDRWVKPALRMLRELYGPTQARDFGPLALQALRGKMIAAGWCRGVINSRVRIIRQMFRWAVAQEMLLPSVRDALAAVEGLKRGRSEARESEPVGPVADSVVELTLPHLPATVADMVRLQRLCGMRPGELFRLRPCDVDRSADVWLYRPAKHKTQYAGKGRVVFIGPQAQAVLTPYLLRDAQALCFIPAESETARRAERHARRKTPLNCGNRPGTNRKRRPRRKPGERYDANSYRRAVHRACDAADKLARAQAVERGDPVADDVRLVPRWSPNRLRHTAATEIRKRFGLEAAQVTLGHSRADVTQIYAERDIAKGIEVAKAVG